MANGLFDTDYSFLGLPEVGSAVGKPINISQAAINQQLSNIDEVTIQTTITRSATISSD